MDFANDKITILNKEVPVKFTTSGHYSILIGTRSRPRTAVDPRTKDPVDQRIGYQSNQKLLHHS